MEVILVQTVKKLGAFGQIVNVKDGFGRNFLIPQGKAIRATKQNRDSFQAKKDEIELKNRDLRESALRISENLTGKTFTIIRQAGDDGRLYGSVTSKELCKFVSPLFPDVNYSNIFIKAPIRSVGVFEVEISIYSDVTASINVVVAKSENEAHEALREFASKKQTQETPIDSNFTLDDNAS